MGHQIKSNQIYLLESNQHLRQIANGVTIDEQGQQGSEEHLQ